MGDRLQLFQPRGSQKAALISLLGNPTCRDTVVIGKRGIGVTTVGVAWVCSLLTEERIDAIGIQAKGPVCILAAGMDSKYCRQFYHWMFAGKQPWIDDHLIEIFRWEQKLCRQLREVKLYNGNRIYFRPMREAEETNWPVDHLWIDGPLNKHVTFEAISKIAPKKVLWTLGHDHDVPVNLIRRALDEDGARFFHLKGDER